MTQRRMNVYPLARVSLHPLPPHLLCPECGPLMYLNKVCKLWIALSDELVNLSLELTLLFMLKTRIVFG